MIKNEKDLAKAIMQGENKIVLSKDLIGGVKKIKDPSEIIWKSVAAVLITSAFFWSGASAMALGFIVGLPAILTVCGGVGGIVFVTLGTSGTLCAFRLLIAAKTMDVLTKLRNNYELSESTLLIK